MENREKSDLIKAPNNNIHKELGKHFLREEETMKRKICSILCGLLAVGMVAGCGTQGTASNTAKEGNTSDEAQNPAGEGGNAGAAEPEQDSTKPEQVTVWHDGDESIMQVIADEVNKELEPENVTVVFEKKSGLTDQLQLYGNDAENGPDMYFYAHDSLGMFAEMGILAPITDFISAEEETDLLPMTIEAGTYQDTQYLLPVYFETLLFIYNQDLWDQVQDRSKASYRRYLTSLLFRARN